MSKTKGLFTLSKIKGRFFGIKVPYPTLMLHFIMLKKVLRIWHNINHSNDPVGNKLSPYKMYQVLADICKNTWNSYIQLKFPDDSAVWSNN